MRELALFAGAGGGILGGKLLGWRTVCAVEIDAYCAAILAQRQTDRLLKPFPIWSDITTFDGRPWRGIIDVVSGGFPCQDISSAGLGAGIGGGRSGLWVEMARIIREVQPRRAYVENSPALTSRGLGRVLGDLAEMGFDARWGVLGAAHVGAPHLRERIWIMADANRERQLQQGRPELEEWRRARDSGHTLPYSNGEGLERCQPSFGARQKDAQFGHPRWWITEPNVGRMAHGVANRVDRLKAIGNGQVPAVAATAWRLMQHDTSTEKP